MRIRSAPTVLRALIVLSLTTAVTVGLTGPPATASVRTPRHHTVITIGHRGVPVQAPENTLASIDRAARLGIDWVENDVQRTRDGALIVLHDTGLARTTDVKRRFPGRAPWRVSDFTLAEIERLDAGGWFGRRFTGERVPTLGRYLRRIDHNRQKLLMEIKAPELYPGIERQIVAELGRSGWLDRRHIGGRLVVQSFSASSLRMFHRLRPDVTTGFLGAPQAAELRSYAGFVDQINPSHRAVTADWVRSVHAVRGPHGRPLEISAWTVDDADRAVSLAHLGVDRVISNAPHITAAALAEDARDHSNPSVLDFLDTIP